MGSDGSARSTKRLLLWGSLGLAGTLALPSQAAAVQADYTKIVGNQSSRSGAAPV